MSEVKLIKGDSFEILQTIPSGSIDLIVCDPPYLLETMGGVELLTPH